MAGKAKVGLVLSGGGARGAYEVGVIRYLADIGLEPDMYAGASIGALNGAVLVSAGSLRAGARKLESVWRELVRGQVLEVNGAAIGRALVYLVLRRMMGPGSAWTAMKPALMNVLSSTMELRAFLELLDSQPFRRILAKGFDVQEPSEGEGSVANDGAVDNGVLVQLLADAVGARAMQEGKPLWVSVFPSRGALLDAGEWVLGMMDVIQTRPSEYFHVQSLPLNEQIRVLLASAAIPIAFSSQSVRGRKYSDGGIGGTRNSQGNTPVKPLIEAGCTHCIVVHLSQGSMWNRHDFPEAAVIEVRPKEPIQSDGLLGGVVSTFDFNAERVEQLMEQGYRDAQRVIGNSLQALFEVHTMRRASRAMQESFEALLNDGLDERLRRI